MRLWSLLKGAPAAHKRARITNTITEAACKAPAANTAYTEDAPVKKKKKSPLKPTHKGFMTYALAGSEKRDPLTKTAIPSEAGVEEARDWVNHNKK